MVSGSKCKRKTILKRYLKLGDISKIITEDDNQDLSHQLVQSASQRQVPKLCETRLFARVTTLSSVIAKYKAIYLALRDIAKESSAVEARTNAMSFMRHLQSPTLIVSLVVTQFILSFSQPLSLTLQKTSCAVVKAWENIKECQQSISQQRNERKFSDLWMTAQTLATEVDSVMTKPRTTSKSKFRANSGCDALDGYSDCAYYRNNVYYPFIDHCMAEFSSGFSSCAEPTFKGHKVLPCYIADLKESEIEAIEAWYGPDMPSRATFQAELDVWKCRCEKLKATSSRISLIDAVDIANKDLFPNVHEIVRLMLTAPVGSVPCKCLFSSMRRLKDWSRSTMTERRLTGLALLFIHRDKSLNQENVLKCFDSTGHRRIGCLTLS